MGSYGGIIASQLVGFLFDFIAEIKEDNWVKYLPQMQENVGAARLTRADVGKLQVACRAGWTGAAGQDRFIPGHNSV